MLGRCSLRHFKKIRITVKMVKVLKERKIKRALNVAVPLPLCKLRGKIHRQLLVTDGVLKYSFVNGL